MPTLSIQISGVGEGSDGVEVGYVSHLSLKISDVNVMRVMK